jgi:hypothetical protein
MTAASLALTFGVFALFAVGVLVLAWCIQMIKERMNGRNRPR